MEAYIGDRSAKKVNPGEESEIPWKLGQLGFTRQCTGEERRKQHDRTADIH